MDLDDSAEGIGLTASDLFSRFIRLGITVLIFSIVLIKYFDVSYIVLGIAMFCTNATTIFGYLYSVKAQDVLDDPDAPDLAYYLGFILTICALASIFIAEAVLAKPYSGSDKSELIRHSLFQFGIGLTATMMGLWARIHLNALQHSDTSASDPKKIYRALGDQLRVFRQEISNLHTHLGSTISDLTKQLKTQICDLLDEMSKSQKNMSKSAKNYSETLENCTIELRNFIKGTSQSFGEVSNEFHQVSQTINGNLNSNNKAVNQSILGFSDLLNDFKGITHGFAEAEKSFIDSFKNITSATENLVSKFSSVGDGVHFANDHLETMKANMKLSSDALFVLQKEIGSLTSTLSSSKVALGSLAKTAQNLERINTIQNKNGNVKKWFKFIKFWVR
jgi:hypothetical protein